MNAEEKKRIILEHCQRYKDHWLRVYFEDGHDLKLKAWELADMIRSGKINLASVREVEDLTILNRPFKPMLPTSGRSTSGHGSSDSTSITWTAGEVVLVILGLAVLYYFMRRR